MHKNYFDDTGMVEALDIGKLSRQKPVPKISTDCIQVDYFNSNYISAFHFQTAMDN